MSMPNPPQWTATGQRIVQRPTSATVFAILHFVLAGLKACGVLGAILMVTIMPAFVAEAQKNMPANEPNPLMMFEDSSIMLMQVVAGVLNLVGMVLLLIAGVGLIKLRPSGRTFSIIYAFFSLGSSVAEFIMQITIVVPRMEAMMQNMPAGQAGGPPAGFMMTTSLLSGIIGLVFYSIYPILVLIFMNRRPILEVYKPGYSDFHDSARPFPSQPQSYTPADQNNPYSSPFDGS